MVINFNRQLGQVLNVFMLVTLLLSAIFGGSPQVSVYAQSVATDTPVANSISESTSTLIPAAIGTNATETPTVELTESPNITATPESVTPTPLLVETTTPTNIATPSTPISSAPQAQMDRNYLYVYNGNIWSVDKLGLSPRQLTFGGHDSNPVLSPDGRLVAYLTISPDLLAGAPLPQNTCTVDVKNGDSKCITDKPSIRGIPIWSPDSTRIAYVEEGNLIVVSLNNNERRIVATNVATDGPSSAIPAWSPDGNLLTCVLVDDEGPAIWLINPIDLSKRPLLRLKHTISTPVEFTPDGKSVAFVDPFDEGRLWQVSVATMESKRVSEVASQIYSFAWSPFMGKIAYARNDGSLWILDLQTGTPLLMDQGGPLESAPEIAWIDNEENILLTTSNVSGTGLTILSLIDKQKIQLSPELNTQSITTPHLSSQPGLDINPSFDWYRYQGESDSGSCNATNCGPASVAMAIQFAKNNQYVAISDIKTFISGSNCGGTSVDDLRNALSHWGVNYATVTGLSAVRDAVNKRGHIVIVPVTMAYFPQGTDYQSPNSDPANHYNRFKDFTGAHYLVVKGFSSDNNWVIVNDPFVWDGNGLYWYSNGSPKGKNRYYAYANFVSAFADQGNGAIEILDTPGVLPVAPNNPNPSDASLNSSGTSFTFSWGSNGNPGNTQYKMELWGGLYSLTTECDWQTSTSCPVGALGNGYEYSWKVSTRNSGGQEGASSTWTFKVRPQTAQNLRVTGRGSTTVDLQWDASPDSVVSSYNLYYANDTPVITGLSASARSYTVTGLTCNSNYSFKIKSISNGIESDPSPPVSASTTCLHTLSVIKAGNGSGSVTSAPSGINCGSTCAYSFSDNTTVTLTAAQSGDSTFTGWSAGSCSGAGKCTVNVTSDSSVTANFVQNNPLPSITDFNPPLVTAGGSAFTLTVNGSNFINSSVIRWNGSNRTTQFISSTQLTALINAADIATGATIPVTVFNPAPGGGISGSVDFSVTNPLPKLDSIAPNLSLINSSGFTITVNGEKFISASKVRWNGTDLATTYVSATKLSASVPAANLVAAGTFSITVFNPLPVGGTSGSQNFTVINPLPMINSISPRSITIGENSFTLTLNGANFLSTSNIRWNGEDLSTTYSGTTRLQAVVSSERITSPGTASITVFSPAPGGGESSPTIFNIDVITPSYAATVLTTRPTLDWEDTPGATSYSMQVSTSSTFKSYLINKAVTLSSYTLTVDLPGNKWIYWRIYPKGVTPTAWSETFKFYSANPPGAPGLLSPPNTSLVTTYTPRLDWSTSSLPTGTTFDYYQLQIATDSLFNNVIQNLEVPGIINSEKTLTTSLAPNGKFYWRVSAWNTAEQYSQWSAARYFRTPMLPPVLTDIGVLKNLRPTFEWSTVNDATSYAIQVSTSSSFSSTIVNTTVTLPAYTPTSNLTANTTLSWRVQAKGANPSAWSNTSSFDSPNPPSTPSLSSPSDNYLVSNNTPRLDWSSSSLPVGTTFKYYLLQIATDPSFNNLVQEIQVDSQTSSEKTLDTPLDPDGKYYWHVQSQNTQDETSAWSLTHSFRTKMSPPLLDSPGDITTAKTTRPTFTWFSVARATGYAIQISTVESFSSTLVNTTVSTATYTPTSDLPRGRDLYWRVHADGLNPSDWSDVFTFSSANPPSVPSLIAPSDGITLPTTTPNLDWNDPVGAAHYEVQIASTSTFADGTIGIDYQPVNLTPSNYPPSPALAANSTFYWRVRVYNDTEQYSNWSAVRHFNTTLPAPQLNAPLDQAIAVSLRPTFTWKEVSGVINYVIQVSTSPSFSSPAISRTVSGLSYTSSANLASGKKYYWRVYAKGTFNSPWSEVHYFTTQ